MHRHRRLLLLVTPLLTLGLVVLALQAEEPDSAHELRALWLQQVPEGATALALPSVPLDRSTRLPDAWSSEARRLSARGLGVGSRSQGLAVPSISTVPSTPCVAQRARPQGPAFGPQDPCDVGAEIADMTPCPAGSLEGCEAYRAWSEHFGAPAPRPAPVEGLSQENVTETETP